MARELGEGWVAADLEVLPLGDALGAEVRNVDIKTLRYGTAHHLRRALYKFQVLLFREQELTLDDQLTFTSCFGPVDIPWDQNHKHEKDNRIQLISNAGRAGINYKTSTLYWHSDQSFTDRPSRETLLCARQVPPAGGNTLFANMRSAYCDLPSELKEKIEALKARHSFQYLMKGIMARRLSPHQADIEADRFPPVHHPLVRKHPETKEPALYLNELCIDLISGLSDDESSSLLSALLKFSLQDKYIYAHQWRVGDVLIWDNASLMHRAADIPEAYPRLFNRSNTAGDVPF